MNKILLTALALCAAISGEAQSTELEGVEVNAARHSDVPVYRETPERKTDLIHMELKVRFDWDRRHVVGEATLKVSPHFYELDTFVIDAKGMDIHEVQLKNLGRVTDLEYRYDQRRIHIAAPRRMTRKDTVNLYISYTAKPDELKVQGGRAISGARGLYFINPDNDPRGWMRQVWTQGEPESNSVWFPTIDTPNERMTHEIAITVPEHYETVSNGRLDFQTDNEDGTRTDFWLMDMPHAPYLVMLAVGEFACESDEWNGIPVNYFVEPEYREVARQVYPHTLEMLDFFSETLGVPYPWQKYDQIVVRDFVSGAMENTTGVIFADFIYGDEKSWTDGNGEDIVAHEMFHHWFGDLVTCESWANLPLNESFATYGEILWREHKHGADDAAWHNNNDLQSYLNEYKSGKSVDMIRFDYETVLDMFDRHSYSKGGRILHMLRTVTGDEAFFESLRVYLEDNAYTSVEIHNLRLAFEKVTGRDMNWFFNQWFLAKGHPQLKIEHRFDRDAGEAVMTVTQEQDLIQVPLFRLPVRVDVHTSLGVRSYDIEILRQTEEFRFPVKSQPQLVHFDAEQYLLAEIDDNKGDAFLLHQLANGPLMMDRYEAVAALAETSNLNLLSTILGIALDDEFYGIRLLALSHMNRLNEAGLKKLRSTVEGLLDDEHPAVRARVYRVWHELYGAGDLDFYREKLQSETSYDAMASAFQIVRQHDPVYALDYAREHLGTMRSSMTAVMTAILLQNPNTRGTQDVLNDLHSMSPEHQNSYHIYLPIYLMRTIDDADRNRILAEAQKMHGIMPGTKQSFRMGIRLAQNTLQRQLQVEGLSREQKKEFENQRERLDALEAVM